MNTHVPSMPVFSQSSLPFEVPPSGVWHISLSSLLMQAPSSRCVMFRTSAVTAFYIASAHHAFGRRSCGVCSEQCYQRKVLYKVGWRLPVWEWIRPDDALVAICWAMEMVFSAGMVFLNVQMHSGKRRICAFWHMAHWLGSSYSLLPLFSNLGST